MKKSRLVAAMAASVVSLSLIAVYVLVAPNAVAQQPARVGMAPTVALVDVTYIFKNHGRFKSMMEDLKTDMEKTQADWKRQGEAVNKMAENLQNYRAGTPDYKALEEEIVNQKSKIQAQVALAKKEFLQREAKIYYNVYQEIMQEVQYVAAANNISMVLSFNGDPVNPEKPEDVARGLNQPVVYYAKELDITPLILKRVGITPNKSAMPHGVGPGAPTAPAGVGTRPTTNYNK